MTSAQRGHSCTSSSAHYGSFSSKGLPDSQQENSPLGCILGSQRSTASNTEYLSLVVQASGGTMESTPLNVDISKLLTASPELCELLLELHMMDVESLELLHLMDVERLELLHMIEVERLELLHMIDVERLELLHMTEVESLLGMLPDDTAVVMPHHFDSAPNKHYKELGDDCCCKFRVPKLAGVMSNFLPRSLTIDELIVHGWLDDCTNRRRRADIPSVADMLDNVAESVKIFR